VRGSSPTRTENALHSLDCYSGENYRRRFMATAFVAAHKDAVHVEGRRW
jgi:hypothetical protein